MKRDSQIRLAVEDELRFHFEERVREHIRAGASQAEAEARAQAEFGDAHAVKATLETIDTRIAARRRRGSALDAIRQDLRYVVRSLAAAPGFTVLVVVLLGLGIGANGALFTVVDRLFFRDPSGIGRPHELSRLYLTVASRSAPGGAGLTRYLHYPGIQSLTAGLPPGTFAGYLDRRLPLGRGEDAPQLPTVWVTPHYFSLLQVPAPALGRYLTDEECRVPSSDWVAVVSYSEWQGRHGGRPDILGRTVEFQGQAFTIVGVAAREFAGADVDAGAYWMPLGSYPYPFKEPWYRLRYDRSVRMITRSALPRPQLAAMATVAFDSGEPPKQASRPFVAGPLIEGRGPMKSTNEEAISVRLTMVAFVVLVIACANAAGLMLARAVGRRREVAVRLALGMSQGRTASLFLVESLVLSLGAGLFSLLVASLGGEAMRQTLMSDAVWAGALLDGRLALFALALSFVVAVAAGTPAALSARRVGLAPVLKADGRGGGERSSRVRKALLVVQVALSVVLLTGAAAFIGSLHAATSIDTGYDVDRLLILGLKQDVGILPGEKRVDALAQLVARLAVHPAVESVALSAAAPLSSLITPVLHRQDGSAIPRAGDLSPSMMPVTPTFFRTAGVSMVRGRAFDVTNGPGGPPVIVINQAMADTMWPQAEAIGQCLRMRTATSPCLEVIGVVENTHRDGLVEEADGRAPMFFLPQAQATGEFASPTYLLIRTAAGVSLRDAAAMVRPDVRRMLPEDVYATIAPLSASFERQLRPWRLGSKLFTAFGLLALLVASAGVYSGIAYSVGRRTREMGIRMAMGAAASSVRGLVLREGLSLVLAGVAVGIAVAAASTRFIESLLFQTSSSDPIVLAFAATVMLIVGLAGCLVPAARAARVDPCITLRND